MTPRLEDNIKNYYVVCLDILGFESILNHKDYKIVNIAYRDFEHTVKKVINYKSINETTRFILMGDALYFICERLETALNVVISFGRRCIEDAKDFFISEGISRYETPFMIRGGISFGPILLYSPNADNDTSISKQSCYPFNAVGLPIKSAYILSEKPKGIRVAIDESVKIQDYRKYFYRRRDLCEGDRYCEFLWPLCIFEKRQNQRYIQESLEAFWYLYEKNRGKKHEKHYSSTLALLWKAIDKIPDCTVAKEFFENKQKNFFNEIDYIYMLKDNDIYPSSQ